MPRYFDSADEIDQYKAEKKDGTLRQALQQTPEGCRLVVIRDLGGPREEQGVFDHGDEGDTQRSTEYYLLALGQKTICYHVPPKMVKPIDEE